MAAVVCFGQHDHFYHEEPGIVATQFSFTHTLEPYPHVSFSAAKGCQPARWECVLEVVASDTIILDPVPRLWLPKVKGNAGLRRYCIDSSYQ